MPSPEVKLELYLTALNRLADGGYEPIGMDHFALPDDELAVAAREGRLARNFMGYTVKPTSTMIACGLSGIGDLESGYFQNEKKLSRYYEALDAGKLPVERGYLLDDDDHVRRYVITQLMCNFRVSKSRVAERFGVEFDSYFERPLERLGELVQAGFVQLDDEAVSITGAGRLFVRNAAMVFDRHLETKARKRPTFSRTI
jgi:oxygen-independent coproporphyrinogen-3 oxidase